MAAARTLHPLCLLPPPKRASVGPALEIQEGFWVHLSEAGQPVWYRQVLHKFHGLPPPQNWGVWAPWSGAFGSRSRLQIPLEVDHLPKPRLQVNVSWIEDLYTSDIWSTFLMSQRPLKRLVKGWWQQWKKTGTLTSQSLWVPGRDQVIDSFKSFPGE